MARIVNLKSGELPPARERHAMVLASSHPSPAPSGFLDQSWNRTYFTSTRAQDVAIVTERAKAWAEARLIPTVYVRRDD
jgi:hypothetical protein